MGRSPRAVTVGDFDRDGRPDLAVANRYSNTISILRGDGAGGFSTAGMYGVGKGPFHAAPFDANNDGILDLAAADRDGFTVTVLIGRPDGTFEAPVAAPAGAGQRSVAAADLNGDGHQDLVTANTAVNTVAVLLGTGVGTFAAPTQFAVPGSPSAVVVGDFNGDGRPDIASATSGANAVSLLRSNASGGFLPVVKATAGSGPRALVAGDFNLDGRLDVATANYNGNTAGVLLGNGSGGFAAPLALAAGSGPSGITAADFNGDGRLDLATANALSNNVSVFLANSAGGFAPAQSFPAGTGAVAIAAGDFNQDGDSTWPIANERANSVSLLDNDGLGGFVPLGTIPVDARPLGVLLTDLTGDSLPEVVVASMDTDTVNVFRNNGDGTFGPRIRLPGGLRARGLATEDFDEDGQPDLAVANGESNEVFVVLNRTGSIADLAITVTNNATSVSRGAPVTYTVDVANAGPSPVTAVVLALTLPTGLTGVAIAPSAGSFDAGSGTWSGLNLSAGGHAFLTVSGTVATSASGVFTVTATVGAPAGTIDPVPGNNAASDIDPVIKGSADLTISITDGSTTVAAGDPITYTIVATNAGPTSADNARVQTSTPAQLTSLTWTCTASPGSTCAPSGSGAIDAFVNLAVGGTVTHVLHGTINPGAGAGTITATATVQAPPDIIETNSANNTASDVDTLQGNSPPVASAQSVTVAEDGSRAITLSATDADGDSLSYTIESPPTHGALSGVAPNLTYTPTANYSGSDSFTFRASDGTLSSVATVTISVTPVNDQPVALSQAVSTAEDVALSITLGATDADGDALTYTIVTPPTRGTLTGTGAARTYTPSPNLSGPDSLTFVVSDGVLQSAPATVAITVNAVNDAPTVINPIADVSVNGDGTSAAVDVSSVFTDVESGTGLTLSAVSSDPTLVGATFSGSTLNLQLTPNRGGTATVTVRATDPGGAFVEDSFLVVIVRPGLRISVSDATRGEGAPGGVTFTVSLSGPSATTVTVNYVTADGTATAGADYSAASGIVTFAPGVTSRTVSMATVADVLDEDDETFTLVLSSPSGALLEDGQGIGVIVDNDTASLSVADISFGEGSAGVTVATFTVLLSNPSARVVSVDFATALISASAVAGSDFTMRSGGLIFPTGSNTPQTVTVEVMGDLIDEPNEAFSLVLSNAANASISRAVARATIVDDDDPSSVSIGDVSLVEGQSGTKAFVFTVTLSRASGFSTRVRYQTADGTANAGSDYTARSGQLVFAAGVTTMTVSIAVSGDANPEPTETFLVNLHTPDQLDDCGCPRSGDDSDR